MRRKLRNRLFLSALFLAILLLIAGVLAYYTPAPPADEVEKARKALSEATRNQSNLYSSSLHEEARELYDSALSRWREENRKWPLSRNYDAVRQLALQSTGLSAKAGQAARLDALSLALKLESEIDSLEDTIRRSSVLIARLPLPAEILTTYSRGSMLLTEARISLEKKDLHQGMQKLMLAGKNVHETMDYARAILSGYFEALPQWKRWAEYTIEESKKSQGVAIIADKFGGECLVYRKGKLVYRFPADFGRFWLGDKLKQGDQATPEGLYRVTRRKPGAQTRYYRALLLDYPNREDRQRFEEALQLGLLPADARIGGMIEIHGDGGKGVNWTDGCIAITNDDMDLLYPLALPGTPVTIVGSLSELNTYISF